MTQKIIDPKLLEMADVYHLPWSVRFRYLYLPAKFPRLSEALSRRSRKKK